MTPLTRVDALDQLIEIGITIAIRTIREDESASSPTKASPGHAPSVRGSDMSTSLIDAGREPARAEKRRFGVSKAAR